MYLVWLADGVVISKKNGKWILCIDFTDLKKACPKDQLLLPHIDTMVHATTRNELLTFMDVYSSYNQILIHPTTKRKRRSSPANVCIFYKVMPFGLKNAGASYQQLVNLILKEQLGDNMEVYIDDMLVKVKKRTITSSISQKR